MCINACTAFHRRPSIFVRVAIISVLFSRRRSKGYDRFRQLLVPRRDAFLPFIRSRLHTIAFPRPDRSGRRPTTSSLEYTAHTPANGSSDAQLISHRTTIVSSLLHFTCSTRRVFARHVSIYRHPLVAALAAVSKLPFVSRLSLNDDEIDLKKCIDHRRTNRDKFDSSTIKIVV